jgi:primosomal protein N' (replication factor Y)
MAVYAKIVFPLPVEGPFDYSIPEGITSILPGSRVLADFRGKREIGIVVDVSPERDVSAVKDIIRVLDPGPVVPEWLLAVTRELSAYYCCSWGAMLHTALPVSMRRKKQVFAPCRQGFKPGDIQGRPQVTVIHNRNGDHRWRYFEDHVRAALRADKSAILLVPDKELAGDAAAHFRKKVSRIYLFNRQDPGEAALWSEVCAGASCLIIGTRSAVFVPAIRPGVIIVDEERAYAYKQDQVPHYHCREAAVIRGRVQGVPVVLSGSAPSLETQYMCENGVSGMQTISRDSRYPRVHIVDMKDLPTVTKKQRVIVSGFVRERIEEALQRKSKVLVFFNRKGYATAAFCGECGGIVKCPKCSIALVYESAAGILVCPCCRHSQTASEVCLACGKNSILFVGAGAEKIEREISELFPTALVRADGAGQDADILVATQKILQYPQVRFGLVVVLGIDAMFSYPNMRSSEEVYAILSGLACLTSEDLVIQTNLGGHYALRSVAGDKPEIFYREEMSQRKQLSFPPYSHFVLVKVRGKSESKVKESADDIAAQMGKAAGDEFSVVSVGQPVHAKLRGNYYWHILLSCGSLPGGLAPVKKILKNFRRSGIIVTVDVDPV